MHYEEFTPPGNLQHLLQCAWHLHGISEPGHIDTIYPDGCCELIIHLKEPPRQWGPDGQWRKQSSSLFAAQQRSVIRLAPAGEMNCIGIRFQPAASAAITHRNLFKLRDNIVDLQHLDGSFATEFEHYFATSKAQPFDANLWTMLHGRMAEFRLDETINDAVIQLTESHGIMRIDALAEAAGMSLRNFQIKFSEAVGLTPKEFSRVIRLQATIRQLDESSEPLAELASSAGFSDQAHASREVRRMTGLTPARLRKALQASPNDDDTIRMATAFIRGGSDSLKGD